MTAKKKPEDLKPRGRKSDYKTEYAPQVFKLCLLGATDKEIGYFFNVSEQTINTWKNRHPDFFESIKKGKSIADANVAEKLYNRAIGYDCRATKFATSEGKITDQKEYIEHLPPDTTAIIFWLKNRQPEKWRDRKDVDANVSINDEFDSMSDEELTAIVRGEKK